MNDDQLEELNPLEIVNRLEYLSSEDIQSFTKLWIVLACYITMSVLNAVLSASKMAPKSISDAILLSSTSFTMCFALSYGWKKYKDHKHKIRFIAIASNIPHITFVEDLKVRAIDYDNEFDVYLARKWVNTLMKEL